MKRILTILCTMITAIGSASAQNPMAEDMSRWADGWKHAFSKDGVREWKPEFTLRYYAGFVTLGPMLTGGIRIDEYLKVRNAKGTDTLIMRPVTFILSVRGYVSADTGIWESAKHSPFTATCTLEPDGYTK